VVVRTLGVATGLVGVGRGGLYAKHGSIVSSKTYRGCAVALIWGWDTNAFFGHVDPHPRVESACAGSYGQVFSSKLCEAHFRSSEYPDYGGAFFITSRRFWCYKKIRPRCPGKLIHMGLKKKHARMTPHTQIPHADVGPHGRKRHLCPTPR